MKTTHSGLRAWAFDFSAVEDREQGLVVDPRGGIALSEDADCLRQSIMMILRTRPGERLMRPDYGCDLRKLVFAPNDETTAGLAMHYVREAIAHWEPRVEIVNLDAGPAHDAPDGSVLAITLQFRPRPHGETTELSYALNLKSA